MENSVKRMKDTLALIADVAESLEEEMKRNHAPLNQIQDVANIRNIARDAAAFRLRNCDVGTPEEQAERHEEFCDQHRCSGGWNNTSPDCLIKSGPCEFVWAQMPYQKGETDEN